MLRKFTTDRLILRILSAREARMVLEFYKRNYEDFGKYEALPSRKTLSIPYQRTVLEAEEEYFRRGSMVRFFAFERMNPFHVIGTISFRDIKYASYACSTIGYKIDQNYRQKGFGHEMLQNTIQIMSREFKLHRVEALVLPDNIPSIRLLDGLGFQLEGILKEKIKLQGKWRDHYLYGKVV